MTHSGGKPHKVGYAGQTHRITVFDEDQGRRIGILWLNADTAPAGHVEDLCSSLVTRPGWRDAQCDEVKNRETGE